MKEAEEYKRFVLDNVKKALDLRQQLLEVDISADVSIKSNGSCHLHIRSLMTPEKIRLMCKTLKVRIQKTVTSQGFLKYETYVNGAKITANTNQCFYGASALVLSRPRTKAFCKIPTKADEE